MENNWNIILPLGLLIVGIGGFYISNTSKYITIREYETLVARLNRELDQLRRQVQVLEETRPTTGELRAVIEGKVIPRLTNRDQS